MFNAYLLVITEEVPLGLEPVPPPLPLSLSSPLFHSLCYNGA